MTRAHDLGLPVIDARDHDARHSAANCPHRAHRTDREEAHTT